MLRRRLVPLLPALAIGVTAVVLVPTGSASAAPPAATDGRTYVALGDSYAAGYGLPATVATPTGQPVAGCAQTTGDYPHLLAATLGLTLTDVTCSGATTKEFRHPQVTQAGTAPAQLDVFKTVQPDLVTITIGGNDLGFTGIASNCIASGKDGNPFSHPTFASCKAWYGSKASNGGASLDPYKNIPSVLTKVGNAIKAVHAAAPKAKIAVIAYPAIAPDAANTPAEGCFTARATPGPVPLPGFPVSVTSTLPFTDTDVPYLQVLQQKLDAGIAATAAANNVAYADIYPASLAHSACAPEADRWVEPLLPEDAGGTNSLHPNIAGTTAMAAALAPVVTALFPTAPPSGSGSSAPTASGSAPTSSVPVTVPPQAEGTAPLAATGTKVPVVWLVGLGVVLLVTGGVAVRWGRTTVAARH